ncbi:Ger(x)C family spore germination protein [Paenibacillus antri]|uniref:Ger(X)C family spore germination protein n=1 Tax=Paenibacillus antri TaxID=2582848 RepID=A0A5R9G7E9_9BACL|nr:Ger(x)C family spore germination protein [Paenibacillus antri]TLS52337.1 Ger(x)C family spore germination protein [Paenibacillus antri]
MKRVVVMISCFAALLTGCWDTKNIQDINYVVSVGIDYKDERYVVYAQLTDFSNVAKQQGTPRTNAPIWVGKGEGATVSQAIQSLYETSQQHVFWGHVSSFVFTESALQQGITAEVIDNISRFREMRYTQWAYGTKEPIEKLFTTKPFFNLSPLSSILNEPMSTYNQYSDTQPIRLHRFVSDLREPGKTVLLPSLGIDDEVWEKNNKKDPKLFVDGLFAIKGDADAIWLELAELTGLIWLDEQTKIFMLSVPLERESEVQLSMTKPKVRTKARMSGETLYLDVDLRIRGRIVEMIGTFDRDALIKNAEERLRDDIRKTFEYAASRGVDVYQAEHELYRERFRTWSEATSRGKHPPSKVELGDVRATVNLTNSGMYKAKSSDPHEY